MSEEEIDSDFDRALRAAVIGLGQAVETLKARVNRGAGVQNERVKELGR